MADVAKFEADLLTSGTVIDPEGVHSEFVSGMHGQKIDFDKINEGDALYSDWIEINADHLREAFPLLPIFIVGVAKGTNRVVHDVAKRMQGDVVALESYKEKEDSKKLHLKPNAKRLISVVRPALVAVLEDVGTTGSNSVQVANETLEAGAGEVIVVATWKRRLRLERLEEAGVEYQAIIDNPLPTYEPEACLRDVDGFCYRGWEFISRPAEAKSK